jgi:hypothetical protein
MINRNEDQNQEISLDDLFSDNYDDTQENEDDKIFNELMAMFDDN